MEILRRTWRIATSFLGGLDEMLGFGGMPDASEIDPSCQRRVRLLDACLLSPSLEGPVDAEMFFLKQSQ